MQDKAKKSKGKVQEKWYWNWLSKHLYMAVAAVAIVVFALFSMLDVITRHNKELEVPSFAGLSVADAQALAQQNHMRLEVTDSVHIIKMAPGVVYKQNPQVGSKVKKNRRILLTINANTPKMVNMPSLVGHSLRQAQSELASQQLRVGRLIYEQDLATNNVLEQLYKGQPVEPGTELECESIIDIKVGLNPADSVAIVPDLAGKPYAIIKDFLIDNSLNLGKVHFDKTVETLQDSLAAFAYKQEVELLEGKTKPVYGAAVSVYFTLDKSLIPIKEEDDSEDQ